MNKEKIYIGTKIVRGIEMGLRHFTEVHKQLAFEGKDQDGYMVAYSDPDSCSNPDGITYKSWSPKYVFERSYREIEEDEMDLIQS